MIFPPRSARHLVLLAITLSCQATLAPPQSALGQAKQSQSEGIDLVFLVDVSGSMFTASGNPGGTKGNDPERIRWDAVLLATNLLTAEDRVIILPFNGDVPARLPENRNQFVPGKMPGEFFDSRSVRGGAIRSKVRTFIHEFYNKPSSSDEWNGDRGGTSILLAVDRAREILKAERVPGRRRFVIMLTDGKESVGSPKPVRLETLNPPRGQQPVAIAQSLIGLENNRNVRMWLADASNDLAESAAKIYTIGLGEDSDVGLLKMMARSTGGHYQYVANNGVLIDTFRDLIWQLKGCWTKSPKVAGNPPRQEDDLMTKIRDIGVLYYKTVPERDPKTPRTYVSLEAGEDFRFAWKDKSGVPLDGADQAFRAPEVSYTYVHYDHANFPGGSNAPDQLQTSWGLANSNRQIHFSKRTIVPLFKVAPFDKGAIARSKPLQVRVEMETALNFDPNMFALGAMLKQSAGPDQPARDLFANAIPLAYVPEWGRFVGDIDLSSLASAGGESDDYTLVVIARGKPLEQNYSLRDYTLALPPIDLRVDNRLTLKNVGLVKFSNENAKQPPIKIRPDGSAARSVAGSRAMEFRVEIETPPADSAGRPLHLAQFSRTVKLVANPSGDLEGDLTVELPNNVAKGLYTGGKFKVSTADPLFPKMASPLTIPFQVSITTLKVRLNRNRNEIIKLDYEQGEPVASEVLQFVIPGDFRQRLTVAIPETPEMGGFGPAELWLEKTRGTNIPKEHTQRLDFGDPGETFQVYFQPRISHETGFYRFQLDVKGLSSAFEYDSSYGTVHLNFQAPVIKPPPSETVRLQRGTSVVKEVKFGLLGGTAVAREVGFRCVDPSSQATEFPVFRWEGQSDTQTTILLELLETSKLRASPAASPASLRIKITASADMECGKYTLLHGQLWADRTEPQPVELAVEVNDLEVIGLDGPPNRKELSFLQLTKKPLVRTFQVFAAKGNLEPGQVDVAEEGPFINENNNTESPGLHPRMSKEACKHPKDGRAGVLFGLAFPDLDASFEKFSGKLAIRCKDLGSTRSIPCAVQRVELLRSKKDPARK